MIESPPQLSKIVLGRRGFAKQTLAAALSACGGVHVLGQENEADQRHLFNTEGERAVRRGLKFLANAQNEDGSFGTSDQSRDIGVCSLVAMAFMASGSTPGRGPFGKPIDQCVDFLLVNANDSGFIASTPTKPMYGHGFATLCLAEVYGMAKRKDLREKLVNAVSLIVSTQNTDGGWRYQPTQKDADLSVTVCQVMALRAARNAGIHVPSGAIDRCLQYVRRCQNQDGGFMYQQNGGPSSFARTAAAVVAFYCAGVYEDVALRRGLDYLMRFPPASVARDEESYFFYGHYYAALAMWHAGGERWNKWYLAIRDELVRRQKRNGEWETPVWSNEYATSLATIILQIPNCLLPIFER